MTDIIVLEAFLKHRAASSYLPASRRSTPLLLRVVGENCLEVMVMLIVSSFSWWVCFCVINFRFLSFNWIGKFGGILANEVKLFTHNGYHVLRTSVLQCQFFRDDHAQRFCCPKNDSFRKQMRLSSCKCSKCYSYSWSYSTSRSQVFGLLFSRVDSSKRILQYHLSKPPHTCSSCNIVGATPQEHTNLFWRGTGG